MGALGIAASLQGRWVPGEKLCASPGSAPHSAGGPVASPPPSQLHHLCHCGTCGLPMLLFPLTEMTEMMPGQGAAPHTTLAFFLSSQLLSVIPCPC